MGIFENEIAISGIRPYIVSNLDKIRVLLEVISKNLGVTDPLSGPRIDYTFKNVLKIKYYTYSILKTDNQNLIYKLR